jgi:hypothetical protein
MLALFLEKFISRSGKLRKKIRKIIDIFKNLQENYDSFYIFVPVSFFIYGSAEKKALRGQTFLTPFKI